MHTIRDPSKDKPFELEMGWLYEGNGYTQELVPAEIVKAAETKAKSTLESGIDVDDTSMST